MNNNWISVKERLPEPDVDVLVFDGKNIDVTFGEETFDDREFIWFSRISYRHFDKITHWMPLPEPPNSDNNTDTFSEVSGKVIVGM